VAAFLEGGLAYTAIPGVIEQAMERGAGGAADSLEALLEADRVARRSAEAAVRRQLGRAA
jgi:1-deoxy-D-xylulose-5-phosphate reductoisomerase